MAVEAKSITEDMFLVAAKVLAQSLSEEDLAEGALYPRLYKIREVSLAIAVAVAQEAYRVGLAKLPEPGNLVEYIRGLMYEPNYPVG